jgi:integrase
MILDLRNDEAMPAYKDKTKGTWYIAFYYKDWTGVTKHTCKRGFKTKGEAVAYERNFLSSLEHTTDIPFAALVANYLEYIRPRIKPTTMSGKSYIIDKKLMPYFGHKKICEIDSAMIIKWQNELIAYRDENGKPYSRTYLKTLNTQLSAIMNFAVKHYGLYRNPCSIVGSMGKKKPEEEMKIWTHDEYRKYSEMEDKPAFKVFFDTLFYTGMRLGEALALTMDDVLPSKQITINKNYAVVDGQEMFLTTKNESSERTITIPDNLYNELMEYTSGLWGYQPEDRIFYFTKSGAHTEFVRVTKKADLSPIRIHDLRHSHVSMLINMGFDIKQISERLGHSSVSITWDIYAHLYPEKDKELALALNEIWKDSEARKEEIEEELYGDE